jgi:hypothetical protein
LSGVNSIKGGTGRESKYVLSETLESSFSAGATATEDPNNPKAARPESRVKDVNRMMG